MEYIATDLKDQLGQLHFLQLFGLQLDRPKIVDDLWDLRCVLDFQIGGVEFLTWLFLECIADSCCLSPSESAE